MVPWKNNLVVTLLYKKFKKFIHLNCQCIGFFLLYTRFCPLQFREKYQYVLLVLFPAEENQYKLVHYLHMLNLKHLQHHHVTYTFIFTQLLKIYINIFKYNFKVFVAFLFDYQMTFDYTFNETLTFYIFIKCT